MEEDGEFVHAEARRRHHGSWTLFSRNRSKINQLIDDVLIIHSSHRQDPNPHLCCCASHESRAQKFDSSDFVLARNVGVGVGGGPVE